jgi:hypothetical protein
LAYEKCQKWTMLNPEWRMFYVVFDLLDCGQLQYLVNVKKVEKVNTTELAVLSTESETV